MENVLVRVDKFIFPTYIMLMEMIDFKVWTLLLGISFLTIEKALIDVEQGEIVMRSNGDCMSYNIADQIESQFSDDECYMIKVRKKH